MDPLAVITNESEIESNKFITIYQEELNNPQLECSIYTDEKYKDNIVYTYIKNQHLIDKSKTIIITNTSDCDDMYINVDIHYNNEDSKNIFLSGLNSKIFTHLDKQEYETSAIAYYQDNYTKAFKLFFTRDTYNNNNKKTYIPLVLHNTSTFNEKITNYTCTLVIPKKQHIIIKVLALDSVCSLSKSKKLYFESEQTVDLAYLMCGIYYTQAQRSFFLIKFFYNIFLFIQTVAYKTIWILAFCLYLISILLGMKIARTVIILLMLFQYAYKINLYHKFYKNNADISTLLTINHLFNILMLIRFLSTIFSFQETNEMLILDIFKTNLTTFLKSIFALLVAMQIFLLNKNNAQIDNYAGFLTILIVLCKKGMHPSFIMHLNILLIIDLVVIFLKKNNVNQLQIFYKSETQLRI